MTRTLLAFVLAAPFLLSACNTVQGVGEDMSEVGNVIADAAR